MKRGLYIVPSLFTLANLAAGVIAILFAAQGHYTNAAWAILSGIIMDMLDGRVARWAGATSQFGVELDSLADLVTFGVAPGTLIYFLALEPMGRAGYMIAVFFAAAGALRLARFNVKAQSIESAPVTPGFVGLPIPAAAGILASFVLSYELFNDQQITVKTIPVLMARMPYFFKLLPVMMVVLAFLMISTVHYGSFKNMKLARPKSLQNMAFILAGVLLVFTYPQNTIFILFSFYVLSGLLGFCWRYYQTRQWKGWKRRRAGDM